MLACSSFCMRVVCKPAIQKLPLRQKLLWYVQVLIGVNVKLHTHDVCSIRDILINHQWWCCWLIWHFRAINRPHPAVHMNPLFVRNEALITTKVTLVCGYKN